MLIADEFAPKLGIVVIFIGSNGLVNISMFRVNNQFDQKLNYFKWLLGRFVHIRTVRDSEHFDYADGRRNGNFDLLAVVDTCLFNFTV